MPLSPRTTELSVDARSEAGELAAELVEAHAAEIEGVLVPRLEIERFAMASA